MDLSLLQTAWACAPSTVLFVLQTCRFLEEGASREDFMVALANAELTLVTSTEVPGCSALPSDAEAWLSMSGAVDGVKTNDIRSSQKARAK